MNGQGINNACDRGAGAWPASGGCPSCLLHASVPVTEKNSHLTRNRYPHGDWLDTCWHRAHSDSQYLPDDRVGGCAGVALGFGAARYVESLLYQVKATDADMIALPTCAILLTALVATLPAVLRALRTDPTEILRTE